jgi:plasmid maintenance system killer protein
MYLSITGIIGGWRMVFRWHGGRGEAEGFYLDDHSYR